MFRAILALCFFGCALAAQKPSFGRCPDVNTTPDFKLDSYVGKWYEAQRYFAEWEVAGKCISADYSLGENDTINMENNKISILTGELWSVKATARVPDNANPSKLKVKLANDVFGFEADYWVLGTDYENYAVVYNCYDVKFFHVIHAWILTREREAPQTVIDQAIAVAESRGLRRSLFIKSNQSNC